MFVRKLKHKNGQTYIQVISKHQGKYTVLQSFGSANLPGEIGLLIKQAEEWIRKKQGLQELDFSDEIKLYTDFLNGITSIKLVGIELVLGKIFDEIGFNTIPDDLFRHLVLYRLVYPGSKLKTTEYLYRYEQKRYSEDDIYRYMDKLHSKQKEAVQQISFEHTQKILGTEIRLVFYDVTTLYFEIDDPDELRKTGFSKEGRHQHPQILLGLLVSKNGYPLAYEIFPGNKYEGHTMLPILDAFKTKYNLEQLTVVADSGLLSKPNVEELQTKGFEFILGARIKNENQDIKNAILSLELKNGESKVIHKGNLKLIITYSDARAKKDKHNREKGLKRLESKVKTGKLTKASINNRGYNKYLEMEGELKVTINAAKFEEDAQWDGLKGYLSNSKLTKEQIIENYSELWRIEKAFRVAKTDLKIRPIYHRLQRRVEAHICLNFVAYKVYKELERLLKMKESSLSPEKVIEIIQNIHQIEITTPKLNEKIKRTLLLTEEQRELAELFGFGC